MPRKRPCMRVHRHIERGSPEAASLFWSHADRARRAKYKRLPDSKRYGFDNTPSPPQTDPKAYQAFLVWQLYDRQNARDSFMRIPEHDRIKLYWDSVDHCSLSDPPSKPDPYIFGFDEHPTIRPASCPEPEFIREVREMREQAKQKASDYAAYGVREPRVVRTKVESTVHPALAFFDLSSTASQADVKRAYRKRINDTKAHPDQGGDADTFKRITETYNQALTVCKP